MKKIIFLLLLVSAITVVAQDKNLMFGDSVVWFGVDFSHGKFLGDFAANSELGPGSEGAIIRDEIPRWNHLFLKEPLRFPVDEAAHKKAVYFDVSSVTKINSEIKSDSAFSKANTYKIKDPDKVFAEMISKYSSDRSRGLGLVFVLEYFNDRQNDGSAYAVFFDIAEKKVIAWRNLKGAAKGVGIRNHWAGCFKTMLAQLRDFGWNAIMFQMKKK
jgi:hypothetical protein